MATAKKERYKLFIDGEFTDASSADHLTTTDPATEEPIAWIAVATAADVDRAVESARRALSDWQSKTPIERGQIIPQVADRIRDHAEVLARIESQDQGKPIAQAWSDVDDAARYFEYYAGAADKLEGNSVP